MGAWIVAGVPIGVDTWDGVCPPVPNDDDPAVLKEDVCDVDWLGMGPVYFAPSSPAVKDK